jgi:hypothetical protein
VTESIDGKPVSSIMGNFKVSFMSSLLTICKERDMGTLRIHILPNYWIHLSSDYASSAQIFPLGPLKTAVRSSWIVHKVSNRSKSTHWTGCRGRQRLHARSASSFLGEDKRRRLENLRGQHARRSELAIPTCSFCQEERKWH